MTKGGVMDSWCLDIFIACLSAFPNGNQRGVVWLCAGANGWCSLACAMSRTSLAAPLASSGQSFLRSRSWGQGSLGRYTQADLLHLPGIMTLMPGGWSTAVEHSTGSSWAEAVKQVKGLGAVVTGMLLPYADLLAPSKFEKLSPHLHSNPALLTACASCCPCQHLFFFFSLLSLQSLIGLS